MQPTSRSPLPFMKTMDDALAICKRENDKFYLTAFMIEAWLGDVTLKTVAQYAERKSAKNRKLQQDLAAESFEVAFGHASAADFHHVFSSLLRFAEFDDAQSRTLLAAYWPMSLEYPHDNWPKPIPKMNAAEAAARESMRLVANAVRGNPAYGEDGQLYRAMGYVPLSQRQSGLTRKGSAPAAAGETA